MDEVLAVGVTVVYTIGDGRQVSFQTAFAADMEDAKKNAVLDGLVALGERQKLKAERPELVKDLAKHRETLAQFQEDMGRLEADFPGKVKALEKALADLEDEAQHKAATDEFLEQFAGDLIVLQNKRAEEFNAGAAEWQLRQRGGTYKPSGHREANLKRMDQAIETARATVTEALVEFETNHQRAIESARAAIGTAKAERDMALQQLGISEKRYTQAIEGLEARLEEIDAVLGG